MKYLKIFTDFVDSMELLGDAERGRLFTAMLEYAASGAEAELKGNEKFLWKVAKAEIDRQIESYDKRCETNKAIATNRYQSSRIVTKRNESCQDKDKDKEKKKNNNPPISPLGEDADINIQRFESFWKLYPNKKAKQDARKAWGKLKVDNELYTLIMKSLVRQTKSQDWLKENGKYVPYPATWLNGHRWEDEVEVIQQQVTPTERPKYEKLTLRR